MANKIMREIIHIDEEKCDGCGLCVPAGAEGALQIIDGKARLVGERLCDGLGACLGDCPRGAISLKCGQRGLLIPKQQRNTSFHSGCGGRCGSRR